MLWAPASTRGQFSSAFPSPPPPRAASPTDNSINVHIYRESIGLFRGSPGQQLAASPLFCSEKCVHMHEHSSTHTPKTRFSWHAPLLSSRARTHADVQRDSGGVCSSGLGVLLNSLRSGARTAVQEPSGGGAADLVGLFLALVRNPVYFGRRAIALLRAFCGSKGENERFLL